MPERRWSAGELAEAFHLAHAADYLVRTDLLDDEERPAGKLAADRDLDPVLLARMLDLLTARTDLVVKGEHGYRRGPGLGPEQRAVVDQYLGAYGPNSAALPDILSSTVDGRTLVNRDRHARAFATAPGAGAALLPELLRKLGLTDVLDLGCGSGELLIELARRDPEFRGWGVDANPAMVDTALERSQTFADRVRFFVGDVTEPKTCVPDEVRADVRVVVGSNIVNEFFHAPEAAAEWLRALGEAFPERVFVVVDYYGTLGHSPDPSPRFALHDWIQLISGQGMPPPDLTGWQSVYRDAGCTLLHAIEDKKAGVFIHLVRLPAVVTDDKPGGKIGTSFLPE